MSTQTDGKGRPAQKKSVIVANAETMVRSISGAATIVLILAASAVDLTAAPQDAPAAQTDPTASPPAQSSPFAATLAVNVINSGFGTWMAMTPTVGYTFDRRWSMEFGVPLYYLNARSTADGGSSQSGPGDVYTSVSLDLSTERLELYTTGSVSAATGSASQGLGAGQAIWDWSTYVAGEHGRLGPYATVGLANNLRALGPTAGLSTTGRSGGISNGNLMHLDAGLAVGSWRESSVSLSAYLISAFGNQAVVASPVPRFRPYPVGAGQGPGGVGAARPPGGPADPRLPGGTVPGGGQGNPPAGTGFGPGGRIQPFGVTAADEISDRGVTLAVSSRVAASTTLSLWVSQSLQYDYTTVSIGASIDLASLARKRAASPGAHPSRP